MGPGEQFQRGRPGHGRIPGHRVWLRGGEARDPEETLVLTIAEHGISPLGPRPEPRLAPGRGRQRKTGGLTAEYFSPNTTLGDARMSREEAVLARLQELARTLVSETARGEAVLPESSDPPSDAPNDRAAVPALPAPVHAAAPQEPSWRDAKAPSQTDLEALAAEAFSALPTAFRSRCEGVAILVRDLPEQNVLDALGLDNEFDLLGLYEGVDLSQEEAGRVATDVNRIFLYRRPLLDYWSEHDETLGALITHVLVHEIGHHFGLSDEQMEAIEAAAGP